MNWLKSIPDWCWLALVIALVANHIDGRLRRIEDLLFDLHERFTGDGNDSEHGP